MSKSKKIKAVVLLIIFALSIILIVSGATMSNENNDGASNGYQKVYLNQSFSGYTDSKNYTVEFTPTASGYYSLYIDGARFTKITDNTGHSSSLSYSATNITYNYTTYDFMYREYLSYGTTYYLNTNSNNGAYITIYIVRY